MISLPTPPQSSPPKGPSTPHRTLTTTHLPMSSPTPTPTPSKHPPPPTLQPTTTTTGTNTPAPPPARLQQDLLLLTSFNDNTSLHFRPAWFPPNPNPGPNGTWTLHNPPNVVTERLPSNQAQHGTQVYTRRMRREGDSAPLFMKDWGVWERYCEVYGVPRDFLCEGQVGVMREGLGRDEGGSICAPPSQPLYPEPPLSGRYALRRALYTSHLPDKFAEIGPDQILLVEADGKLVAENLGASWEQVEGRGYRWSYVPWTEAMEVSCRPWSMKFRL